MYRFKYSNKREYADFYAKEAVRIYGDWIRRKQIEAIVPVPMYRLKEKGRGYNQEDKSKKSFPVSTKYSKI